MTLTKPQARALAIVATGEIVQYPQFARRMWPDSPVWSGSNSYRRNGIAQRAGSFLRDLERLGLLITIRDYGPGNGGTQPAYLTKEGKIALASYEAARTGRAAPVEADQNL